jgi:Domain of unknown function (DUF4326)
MVGLSMRAWSDAGMHIPSINNAQPTFPLPLTNGFAMSDAPIRVQLKRTKGWRMPANTVKVDRTTKWGNPYQVGKSGPYGFTATSKRHAWQLYLGFAPTNEKLVAAAREELRGKNLACWCAKDDDYEDACHAAVLLKIANE